MKNQQDDSRNYNSSQQSKGSRSAVYDKSERKNYKNILTQFMATEGSSNVFGPPGLKKPSLFGNLHGFESPNKRKSFGPSGAKSELGFAVGPTRPSLKGGKKVRGNTANQFVISPNKGNALDKSSMMSRFSYMSAGTVFLQYRSNTIYFNALAQQRAAFEAEIAEMEKMMQHSFGGDDNKGFELIDLEDEDRPTG